MRLVTIENLEYEKFEKIRDILFDIKNGVPYGIISYSYSKNLKTGYFQFWDEFYIPRALKKFISRPPGTEKKMDKLSIEITGVLNNLGNVKPVDVESLEKEKEKKNE